MDPLSLVRSQVAKFVGESGACDTDPVVVEAINEARRILYPLGDWIDITDPICVKPYNCALTLPMQYQYAKKAYVCCVKAAVQNDWFTPVQGDYDDYCGRSYILKAIPGKHATFRDWPEVPCKAGACNPVSGFYIKTVFESDYDCEVALTFNGVGETRRVLSLTRVFKGPAWGNIMAGPGEMPFLKINSVIKPKTAGRIRVYGYDGANEILMAVYEPEDVNPSYARYHFRANGSAVLKAKKRFIPLVEDTEFVDIHTEALIHAIQAITDRQNRNLPGFNANLKMAVDFLNRELAGPESTATSQMRMSGAYRVTGLIE